MYVLTNTNPEYAEYLSYFPKTLKDKLERTSKDMLCEIRIGKNRPIVLKYTYGRFYINTSGELSKTPHEATVCTDRDFLNLCENITEFSIYAHEDELKNAFITVKGGHRIGFAGEIKSGRIRNLRDITSINFRIAHEHTGIAERVLPYVLSDARVKNTIIVSPPMCGKTTLLRDMVRLLSKNLIKVGICDTRGEIAASYDGRINMDIGDADVITGTEKAIGMMMLLRCMSPEVIACDELGSIEDFKTVETLMHSGVSVIATAHAQGREALYKSLKEKNFNESFETVITLCGTGEICEVYNA